jgi:hypothetical protein
MDGDDPGSDNMPVPSKDTATPDLLSLCTAKLAWAVANQPDLYSAQLLQVGILGTMPRVVDAVAVETRGKGRGGARNQ